VSDEAPADQSRRQTVAGASDESVDQLQALLPATGISDVLTWLMLALASMLIAVGSAIRAWQLRRS
jgi:hypothetical protein